MITKSTIYEWANRDARTGSIPSRNEDGSFEPSNGIRQMFNHPHNAVVPEMNDEKQRLQKEQKGLYQEMLHQQSVYSKNKLSEQDLIDKENELERKLADLDILEEDILQEKQRLVNRGHRPPERVKKEDLQAAVAAPKKRRKINWKALKKWSIVFLSIVVLEGFFGLALWDSLRDQKSIVQVALRIAASGILVITLHIAEHRYKTTQKKIYAGYIVYGILTLVALLIGSLVLGYFFPEYLEGNAGFDTNVFDLNANETLINPVPPNSIIGFFIRYDFILGIIAVIVFMLIGFLETGKRKKTDKTEDAQVENEVQNDINLAFAQLLNLYEKKSTLTDKVSNLKREVEKLKSEPNTLSVEILELLRKLKQKIESNKTEISNAKNLLEQRYNQLEEQINQYKIDFTDVYNSLPASSFANPVWPVRNDINQYYKIS